jgi:hypothetical protein
MNVMRMSTAVMIAVLLQQTALCPKLVPYRQSASWVNQSNVLNVPITNKLAGYIRKYEGVSKSFRTESITKYTLTTINTR